MGQLARCGKVCVGQCSDRVNPALALLLLFVEGQRAAPEAAQSSDQIEGQKATQVVGAKVARLGEQPEQLAHQCRAQRPLAEPARHQPAKLLDPRVQKLNHMQRLVGAGFDLLAVAGKAAAANF